MIQAVETGTDIKDETVSGVKSKEESISAAASTAEEEILRDFPNLGDCDEDMADFADVDKYFREKNIKPLPTKR